MVKELMNALDGDHSNMYERLPFQAPRREQGRRMERKNGLVYATDGTVYDPRPDGWRRVNG